MIQRKFSGAGLREGRIYRRLTITDLSQELNVSKQMISKYESDKATPNLDALLAITRILRFISMSLI